MRIKGSCVFPCSELLCLTGDTEEKDFKEKVLGEFTFMPTEARIK